MAVSALAWSTQVCLSEPSGFVSFQRTLVFVDIIFGEASNDQHNDFCIRNPTRGGPPRP